MNRSSTPCSFRKVAAMTIQVPFVKRAYTHPMKASCGRVVLPLLLWRRGLGRGGPLLFSPFVAAFQRVAAPMYLAGGLRTTTSSPWPSPPKEERELAPRPVRTERRVRCMGSRAREALQ